MGLLNTQWCVNQRRHHFYESTNLRFSQQYQSVEWKHHVQTPIVRNKNIKLFQGFVWLMIHKVILPVDVFYRTLELSFLPSIKMFISYNRMQ